MKQVVLFLINLYQNFISYLLKNILGVSHFCRFRPTCSDYAKMVIKKEGVIKGIALSVIRVSKCQPFYRSARV
ncbi:MAG TPA: membrane protein insertion efficiency factor YidD [Patescibacteria group bacterium]|nr:membrane protein insertion efficiency factor YidD [Patescibacteria group bacterium]